MNSHPHELIIGVDHWFTVDLWITVFWLLQMPIFIAGIYTVDRCLRKHPVYGHLKMKMIPVPVTVIGWFHYYPISTIVAKIQQIKIVSSSSSSSFSWKFVICVIQEKLPFSDKIWTTRLETNIFTSFHLAFLFPITVRWVVWSSFIKEFLKKEKSCLTQLMSQTRVKIFSFFSVIPLLHHVYVSLLILS